MNRAMTSERAQAYGRVTSTLADVGPTKLPPAEQTLSDLKLTRLPVDNEKMRKDLSLFLTQSDGLAGRFRYNRDVLDPERVARMRDRFLQILSSAVAEPELPLTETVPESVEIAL